GLRLRPATSSKSWKTCSKENKLQIGPPPRLVVSSLICDDRENQACHSSSHPDSVACLRSEERAGSQRCRQPGPVDVQQRHRTDHLSTLCGVPSSGRIGSIQPAQLRGRQ